MRKALIIFLATTILLSCKDSYNYVTRKGTPAKKYEFATKAFSKKKYGKAQPLLEEIYPLYKGKKEAEDIYYMLAYSHYKLKDFLLASYHFENFASQYSLSPRVEECSYLHCICEYNKSLPAYLDQSITKNSIDQFQIFINNFPDSKYMAQCNDYIDKLRAKLHKKAYDNAMLYYQIGDYKAASVAFQNAINDYADLPQKEEFEYLIVKVNYLYAKNSILALQPERYKKALESAQEFFAEHTQNQGQYYNQVTTQVSLIKAGLAKAEAEIKRRPPVEVPKTNVNVLN
jgi:outer membrane protein assembly factor BamD